MRGSLGRRVVSSAFYRMGPDLRQHTADLVSRSFEEVTYRRLGSTGYAPGAIIDVGAYKGDWTRMARAVFGTCPALMVEAQEALLSELAAFSKEHDDLHLSHAVLGADSGQTVTFYEMGTGSSFFAETSDAPRTERKMTTRTLDEVFRETLGEVRDIFLKIDVQGAELQVLAGASEVLERASLVQLELAMLRYNDGAPLLPEVVGWMAEHGWLPTEVSGFSRPRTTLVQIDMLFAREGSPLRPAQFEV